MSGTDRLRNRINGRVLPSSSYGKAKAPKATGRFEKINWFVDVKMAELTNAESCVWFALWREERNDVVSLSLQQIADKCGVNRSTAIRTLKKLIERKIVRRIEKGNSAKGTCNKYTLATPT